MSENRQEKYENKRQVKRTSFNLETEKELFDYAQSLPDFSNWVKERLKDELNKTPALASRILS